MIKKNKLWKYLSMKKKHFKSQSKQNLLSNRVLLLEEIGIKKPNFFQVKLCFLSYNQYG